VINLDGPGREGHHERLVQRKGVCTMPDKGPGSKGGAKKPKGGGKTASKNGKK
jgi:hypothetical protein